MDLRLAGFGWVLSFFRAGEEVLCTGKGQHGWFQGTTTAFAYTQNVRLVNTLRTGDADLRLGI